MKVSNPILADRYELGALLGRGGMAEVHRGRDRVLDRAVAIKLLNPHRVEDPRAVALFDREARAAAALAHPGIVTIFDTGSHADSSYIVMELVEGETLAAILRSRGPLSEEQALELASGVAEALGVAHHNGIIHRDVKPSNVIVTPEGTVKVTDFGIARAVEGSQTLTEVSAIVGTAAYLAPEQARGEPVDPRSDVYALGAMLYHMVTGTPPFVADSPVAVAYKHVSEPPQPPSELNPEVSSQAEAEILRALAKDPEKRHPSAEALATRLRAVLDGADPKHDTEQLPIPAQGTRRRRRSRLIMALAAIVTVAAIAFSSSTLLTSDEGDPSRGGPRLPRRSGIEPSPASVTNEGQPALAPSGSGSPLTDRVDEAEDRTTEEPSEDTVSSDETLTPPEPSPTEEPSPTVEPSASPGTG